MSLRTRFNDGDSKTVAQEPKLTLISRLRRPMPTTVLDTYWKFAVERQNIFFKRYNNEPEPLTNDTILATHKFTNVYRASDRTSQFLIRSVIYRNDLPNSAEEVFFRTILFKLFNKIETWLLLEKTLGNVTFADYSFALYDEVLTKALLSKQTIYSAAYIMPSCGKVFGHKLKHRNHLKLLEKMMQEALPQQIAAAQSMECCYKLLLSYPSIGNFLAYQFATDLNYSEIINFSEMDFVTPGPGARDGIRKCFSDLGDFSETDIIKFVADAQEIEFARLNLNFQNLWGRRLQLIDCQNLFCEVDKYSRAKHPEIKGLTGRVRIKQKYIVKQKPLNYWYPPKWKINHALGKKDKAALA